MAKKPLTLAPPKKDFGKALNSTTVFTIILLVYSVAHAIKFIVKLFTDIMTVTPADMMILLIAIGVIIYVGSLFITSRKTFFTNSVRIAYVRKHLIPYLRKKYKKRISKRDALKIIEGEILFKDKEKRPVFFYGWDEIEKEAAEQKGIDLTEHVFLLRKEHQDREDYFEYPPADGEGGVSFHATPDKVKIPDGEITAIDEAGIHLWMSNVMEQLPVGKTRFESVNGKDAPDPWNIFELTVESDGSVVYSRGPMKKFVRELALLCQDGGQNLVAVFFEPEDADKIYGVSVLLSERGIFYYDYPEGKRETLSEMKKPLVMLSSLEDLFEILNEKPELDNETKHHLALMKKIIMHLPPGETMLMVADTLDENGAPMHLTIEVIDENRVNYSDIDLLMMVATIRAKIAEDGQALLLSMIDYETEGRTYALGIFAFENEYSVISAQDMKDTFHLSNENITLIESLDYFSDNNGTGNTLNDL